MDLQNDPDKAREKYGKTPDMVKEEIQRVRDEINSLKTKLKGLREEISQLQQHIDDRVRDLVSGNPEVADAIKAETVKKYIEKTKEKQEEVAKLTGKKEKIAKIKDIVKQEDILNNALREILERQSRINQIKADLDKITIRDAEGKITYTDEDKAKTLTAELTSVEQENKTSKQAFIQSAKQRNLEIEENDIDEFISGKIIKDREGKILVDRTLENKEKSINRQLDENNKDISHYLSELEKRGVSLTKDGEISPAQEPKNGKPERRNLPAQTKERWYKKLARKISNFLHRNNEEPEDRGIVGQQDENAEQQDENMRSQQEKASKEFLDRIRNLGIIKEVVDREEKPFERTNAQPQQDNGKKDHGGRE